MAWHNQTGKIGEDASAQWLEKHGYTILERNWRLNHWEVDIIAQNKDYIVFVEVKTRSSLFGDKQPQEYVDDDKKRRVAACANAYIKMTGNKRHPRFDIASVLMHHTTHEIESMQYLEDAFDVPLRTIGTYHKTKRRTTL
ncbi:MAG: YraN family protein [Paludibacteraceae bacterium]|nr:YraN family protein [Paludibacteraceae bacterium]